MLNVFSYVVCPQLCWSGFYSKFMKIYLWVLQSQGSCDTWYFRNKFVKWALNIVLQMELFVVKNLGNYISILEKLYPIWQIYFILECFLEKEKNNIGLNFNIISFLRFFDCEHMGDNYQEGKYSSSLSLFFSFQGHK